MRVEGRAHVVTDDVDTDQIIPSEYLHLDFEDLGEYALAGYDEGLADAIDPGDVLVGGANLGLGSSREHAPVALKRAGIEAVVAESAARIFYRNCINLGLPIVEVDGITAAVDSGDRVAVDLDDNHVVNRSTGERFETAAVSGHVRAVLDAGGLVAYRRRTRK